MADKMIFKEAEGGSLIGIIGDEDSCTGFLMAGIGQVELRRDKNFMVVTSKTTVLQIEEAFRSLTKRQDICILLITQAVAEQIRDLIDDYQYIVPAIIEIPDKNNPYDVTKDSIMTRIYKLIPSS